MLTGALGYSYLASVVLDATRVSPISVLLRSKRVELGLSQSEVASAMCTTDRPTVTSNDVARWERGKRIPRSRARRVLEEVLGLPIHLLDHAAAAQRAHRTSGRSVGVDATPLTYKRIQKNMVDEVRKALLSCSHAPLLVDAKDQAQPSTEQLDHEVGSLLAAYQGGKFDFVLDHLPDTLYHAHIAVACADTDSVLKQRALALSCQSAAMVLTKLGETDLAWVASERGFNAAQQIDNQLVLGSLRRSMVHSLQSAGSLDMAIRLAAHAGDEFRSANSTWSDAEHSIYGTLLLASAMAAARIGDHALVNDLLDESHHHAQKVGQDRNLLWTAFGPTNIAIHRVATAIIRDDISSAEKYAKEVDISFLPQERRVRYTFDLATIALRRNKIDRAISLMLEAEQQASEVVYRHIIAGHIITELCSSKTGRQNALLLQLSARTTAMIY